MATILPPGETTFNDANGAPLAGGSVYMYVPSTLTPKTSWQDAGQTIANTNPIILDAAGRAIIYGSGTYRQLVKDANGNTIWDQLTADTASGGVVWGGVSGGTANAQTITASSFSQTDGQALDFIAGFTNTGQLTMAVGGGSPIPVLRDSLSGPTPCTGNEVIATNAYSLIYEAARGAFHLVNDTPQLSYKYVAAGGTGNAITATFSPALAAYVTGQPLYVKAFAANTSAVTFNANGLGAVAVKTTSLSALIANQILPGMVMELVYDGTQFQLTSPAPINYRYLGAQIFSNSGTYTPSAGCAYIEVEGCGGGGGGGSAQSQNANGASCSAGGGGAGAWGRYVSSSPVTTTVTIGALGAGSTSTASSGSAGGQTSFGSLLVLGGGLGGKSLGNANGGFQQQQGGDGGTATAGTLTAKGAPGAAGSFAGFTSAPIFTATGGSGGSGPYGGGGLGGNAQLSSNTVSAAGSGAGGDGAGGGGGVAAVAASAGAPAVANGGAGSPGVLIVHEYGLW